MADTDYLDSLFGLDGRVALVTGASSGLGARFSGTLAKAGASVLLAARRADRLQAEVDAIAVDGGKAAAVTLDVTDAAAIGEAFDAAEAAFGPVDLLVNNAGIAPMGTVVDMPVEDWDAVIEVNLRAAFLVAREGARRMIAQGAGGAIVNIASILGDHVMKQGGAYCVSKGGVLQLTRTMALELARYGIRVNAIAPGYVATEMNDAFFASEAGQKMIGRIPMRRVANPGELDAALLMLAGAGGSFTTGSVVTVDGGHTLVIP
ncbi:MAG: SDR family oxidoreductase [Alphaproteobacteria bacterium]|nr:SDR family oxidoreductase [Alphaproteobacteria bacterium]